MSFHHNHAVFCMYIYCQTNHSHRNIHLYPYHMTTCYFLHRHMTFHTASQMYYADNLEKQCKTTRICFKVIYWSFGTADKSCWYQNEIFYMTKLNIKQTILIFSLILKQFTFADHYHSNKIHQHLHNGCRMMASRF